MTIRQLYSKYHDALIAELTSKINDVIQSVEAATEKLPEDEVMNILVNYPDRNTEFFCRLTEDTISFNFADWFDVGEVEFDNSVVLHLIEFISKYYDSRIKLNSFIFLDLSGCILMDFYFDEGTEKRGDGSSLKATVEQFCVDLRKAFPTAKVSMDVEEKKIPGYFILGSVSITIPFE